MSKTPQTVTKGSNAVPCNNQSVIKSKTTGFVPTVSYYFLAINGFGPLYRAFLNKDTYTVAFILFLYLAVFLMELCFRALHRLPPNDKSLKKDLLLFVVWLLTTSIIFTILLVCAPFFHWAANLFFFSFATAGSASIFYVYFFYDSTNGNSSISSSTCSNSEKTKSSQNSEPAEEVITDKELAILDKV